MTEELTISNQTNQNIQSKELLYSLFYELTSEIKGKKIEIDEEVYQENIRITTISQLIDYIRNTIQILIKKKIQEAKTAVNAKQTQVDDDERTQYESSLRQLEAYQRRQIKIHFEQKLKNEAIDNRMNELIEIEEEYDDMKTKLKYDEGKFLDNDRKDNEILILRAENTNLRKSIVQLELQVRDYECGNNEKDKQIKKLKEENGVIQAKLEKTQKELSLISNINININNNNNNNLIASASNGSNSNSNNQNSGINNNNNDISNSANRNSSMSSTNVNNNNDNTNSQQLQQQQMMLSSKGKCLYCTCNNINSNNNSNGIFIPKGLEKQITILNIKSIKAQTHKTHTEGISASINQIGIPNEMTKKNTKKGHHQRNNSMNMLLDKKKMNLISKYFSHQSKIPIKQIQQSGSCKKMSQLPLSSIQKSCTNRTNQIKESNGNGNGKQKQKTNKSQQNVSNKSSVSYGSISKADI